MQNVYLTEALALVKAQSATRPMTAEEITASVKALATELEALDNPQATEAPAEPELPGGVKLVEGFKPKGAIRQDCIISGLDGKAHKMLTAGHFKQFGVTKDAYLAACGYKKGTSLSCKALSEARRAKMASMELWKRRKPKTEAAAEAY